MTAQRQPRFVTAVTQSANGFCLRLRNAQFLKRVIGNSTPKGQMQTRLRGALIKGRDSEKPSKKAGFPFFQLLLGWLYKEQKLKTQGLARWWSPSHKGDKAKREMRSRFHKQEEEKEVQGH